MSHARRTLLVLFLAAAAPACADEVLTVPTDASTSDRAADSPAAKSDAEAGASADATAASDDVATESGSEETDGGAD
jgi:hypothetical protein